MRWNQALCHPTHITSSILEFIFSISTFLGQITTVIFYFVFSFCTSKNLFRLSLHIDGSLCNCNNKPELHSFLKKTVVTFLCTGVYNFIYHQNSELIRISQTGVLFASFEPET